MPRTAVRIVVVLLALFVAGLGAAIEARGENAPPSLELLEPADGATIVVSPEENKGPVYRIRVTYPAGYSGIWIVTFENTLDPAFIQDRSVSNHSCTPSVLVCDLSFTTTNYKPGARVYWRISIPTLGVVSPVRSFVVAGPADRDHDGVPDFKDNCPSKSNARQTDEEGDGKGDACQPDRKTPRVKAYAGSARRNRTAFFLWRATDNRLATIRLTLRWHGRVVLAGGFPNMSVRYWGASPFSWWSEKAIDSRFPIGTYSYCVTATDAAGNKGTSCAPYKIKAAA